MHEALLLVRRELGPEAAVLHTREIRRRRWFGLAPGHSEIEVTASVDVNVPSRLPPRPRIAAASFGALARRPSPRPAPTPVAPPQPKPEIPAHVQGQIRNLQGMVADLRRRPACSRQHDLPDALFRLFTDLIEADANEKLARELVERVREETPEGELADPVMVKARLARILESELQVAGPIAITPGRHRVVALVGPTGVGKTTTIAKLAANYRLKMRQNVGLITVDTYRIAAVEQLRTYADIIDLPMQVVSTPREMREAVHRLSGLDLILMDTAGRSPRDEIKIQELKAFLTEAGADEVHLVQSGVASERTLEQTAKQFATVGTTAMILTKLDEATGLGNVLPLLRSKMLPLSYLTNGQNVPDDIETADAARITQLILSVGQDDD